MSILEAADRCMQHSSRGAEPHQIGGKMQRRPIDAAGRESLSLLDKLHTQTTPPYPPILLQAMQAHLDFGVCSYDRW